MDLWNIRQNLRKRPLSFRPEIGIFDTFFKRLYGESLKIYKAIKNLKSMPLFHATMAHN